MRIETLSGVRIRGISAALPAQSEDSVARCTDLFKDAERAKSVVAATGIASRRLACPGVTPCDLCVAAAERLFERLRFDFAQVGAVVFVSFTAPETMPAASAQAQARLGLSGDAICLDLGLACSGYVAGLFLAGLLARQTGRAVLLLDGDVQSRVTKPDDEATVPVLADAGTATLVEPADGADPWTFAFETDGAKGAALRCPAGGPIAMDGLAVFKYVATDVARFLSDFLAARRRTPSDFGAFVPHQPNVYLVRRLAKALGFAPQALRLSADRFGNSASATVPVTLAVSGASVLGRRILLSGFGGGLSAAAAEMTLPADAVLDLSDYGA